MLPVDELDPDNFSVVVSNLQLNTTRAMLWDAFEKVGPVKQVDLRKTNTDTQACIVFVKKVDKDAFSELKINGHEVVVTQLSTAQLMEGRKRNLPAQSFAMGVLPSLQAFIQEYVSFHNVSLEIHHSNFLEVKFLHLQQRYRVRIPLEILKSNLNLQRKDTITSLNISLKYPGYFHRFDESQEQWIRVTEIPIHNNVSKKLPMTVEDDNVDAYLSIPQWNFYRIEFDIPQKSHDALEQLLKMATLYQTITTIPQRSTMIQVYKPPSSNTKQKIKDSISQLPFKVQYMIQHALKLRILNYYNINVQFCQTMRDLGPTKAEKVLMLMTKRQDPIYTPDTVLKAIWENVKNIMGDNNSNSNDEENDDDPEAGYVSVRKLVVTPTCIYPLQPVIQRINLIQQQFPNHIDRFLIVQFTDEELQPLTPCAGNDAIYDRIFDAMKFGIKIGGRRFDFMCTSPELMERHICWFFAPTLQLSIPQMMYKMGDFEDIDNLTDYIKGTGQFLVQPLFSFPVRKEEIEIVNDVELFDDNFTKGCGKISPYFMRDIISKELGLAYTPSVIEFHLAGTKGILHISNFLKGRRIDIRASQIYYNSDNFRLELKDWSKPEKVFLDQRRIMILSSIGVNQRVLIRLLEDMMAMIEKPYSRSLINDYFTVNGIFQDFDRVIAARFLERDPFISQLFTSYQHDLIRNIYKHANIYIPEGAKCYAIMDETGTLESDEIFFQTMDEVQDPPVRKVIQGPVLVYGDSSCSADDFKVFFATDCKKLNHITNVIVFSSKQSLGLPSLFTSDPKDEKHFTIIWNNDLIPLRHKPRYTYIEPALMNFKPTRMETMKFIVKYISNDNRREIEDAFIATADRNIKGAMGGTSMFLGRQLTLSLDFNRSGIAGSVPDHLKEYPKPDFASVSPEHFQTYKSKSVLGYIYRMTQYRDYDFPPIKATYDERLFNKNMVNYIREARLLKERYDFELQLILCQYSVYSEVELVSACVHRLSNYIPRGFTNNVSSNNSSRNNRFQQGDDDYLKNIRQAYFDLRNRWRLIFENNDDADDNTLKEKAAAWYYVTYHPTEIRMKLKKEEASLFYSFAWVADDYLCDMALEKEEQEKQQRNEETAMNLPELDGLIINDPNESGLLV